VARPSPLTDKQWQEIGRRYNLNESARDLAKEFGVSDTAIRKRFSSQQTKIKDVANQVVSAEKAFQMLPVSSQISAQNLINDLRQVSNHLAGAAKYGAATAHRLSGIANEQVEKIDGSNVIGSVESLREVAALTKLANEASVIGMGLLNSSKDTLKNHREEPPAPQPYVDRNLVKKIVNELESEY
jgi:hypothetical protein